MHFLKYNILYLCICSRNFCNISMCVFFVMHLPEDGHMSGRNMYGVYVVYNVLSYVYVHLLFVKSYIFAQCTVMDHLKMGYCC
jgi:hypothetical protein